MIIYLLIFQLGLIRPAIIRRLWWLLLLEFGMDTKINFRMRNDVLIGRQLALLNSFYIFLASYHIVIWLFPHNNMLLRLKLPNLPIPRPLHFPHILLIIHILLQCNNLFPQFLNLIIIIFILFSLQECYLLF